MLSNAGAVQRYRPSRIKEECNHEGAGRPYFMTRGRRIHLDEIIREKHAVAHRADLAECFLDLTHSAISNALEGAQLGGDYKGNMGALVEVVQRYKL